MVADGINQRVVQGRCRTSLVLRGCLKLNLALALALTLALTLVLALALALVKELRTSFNELWTSSGILDQYD